MEGGKWNGSGTGIDNDHRRSTHLLPHPIQTIAHASSRIPPRSFPGRVTRERHRGGRERDDASSLCLYRLSQGVRKYPGDEGRRQGRDAGVDGGVGAYYAVLE